MAEIKLGSKVKDVLTGFVGFATARCEYINGCIQYEVTPKELKDGTIQKPLWMDEQRLGTVGKKAAKTRKLPDSSWKPGRRGGPQNKPTREHPPSLGGYDDDE